MFRQIIREHFPISNRLLNKCKYNIDWKIYVNGVRYQCQMDLFSLQLKRLQQELICSMLRCEVHSQEVFENYRETNCRSFAAVRFKLKSMVAMTWQPAQEGLAQILQLLKVSSFDK